MKEYIHKYVLSNNNKTLLIIMNGAHRIYCQKAILNLFDHCMIYISNNGNIIFKNGVVIKIIDNYSGFRGICADDFIYYDPYMKITSQQMYFSNRYIINFVYNRRRRNEILKKSIFLNRIYKKFE